MRYNNYKKTEFWVKLTIRHSNIELAAGCLDEDTIIQEMVEVQYVGDTVQ